MTIRCFLGQVIVKPLHRSRRYETIVDPNPFPPAEGQVVAVGQCKLSDGTVLPAEVFIGSWVMFKPYAGIDLEIGGCKLKLMKQSDLEAVITG